MWGVKDGPLIIFSKRIHFQYYILLTIHFSEEFTNIARWVANRDIDPHIVKVIYALLDDDRDGKLSIKEFLPVLFQWRKSRGFQHESIHIHLGALTI